MVIIHGMCLYINTTTIVLRRVKIDNLDHPSKPTSIKNFQLLKFMEQKYKYVTSLWLI